MTKKSKVDMWSVRPLKDSGFADVYDAEDINDAVDDAAARDPRSETVTLYGLTRSRIDSDMRISLREAITDWLFDRDTDWLDGLLLVDAIDHVNDEDDVHDAAENLAETFCSALEAYLFTEGEAKEINVEEWRKKHE